MTVHAHGPDETYHASTVALGDGRHRLGHPGSVLAAMALGLGLRRSTPSDMSTAHVCALHRAPMQSGRARWAKLHPQRRPSLVAWGRS